MKGKDFGPCSKVLGGFELTQFLACLPGFLLNFKLGEGRCRGLVNTMMVRAAGVEPALGFPQRIFVLTSACAAPARILPAARPTDAAASDRAEHSPERENALSNLRNVERTLARHNPAPTL
jgi:hypothetical protein